jgi:hypothetical protein
MAVGARDGRRANDRRERSPADVDFAHTSHELQRECRRIPAILRDKAVG